MMNERKIPVIIDCDPGCDDTIALLMSFRNEKLDIKGITVAAGNVSLENTSQNALRLAAIFSPMTPVSKGLPNPLMREIVTAPEVHGDSGIGGVVLPKTEKEFEKLGAVEFIAKTLRESEEKVVVVITGPMTNIAAFLMIYPELKEKIAYFSIMGGSSIGGNVTPAAEFNIYVDPEAAKTVFESGVEIVMSGLDVTLKALAYGEDIERLRSLGNEAGVIAAEVIEHAFGFHKDSGKTGVPLHDPCAVAYLTHPELFSGKRAYVAVETKGQFTTGETVIDRNGRYGKKANVLVLDSVDRKGFINLIVEGIEKLK